jgi:phage tail sheath protein FI
MPTSIKTPGVYIEEVSKFPPSVAQVETAIPAFFGFTQKAMERRPDDLQNKAKRIRSMAEYIQYYGGAPDQATILSVGGDNLPNGARVETPSSYRMFYSLQMYFANGGGPCYIVSLGDYEDSILIGNFTTGLDIAKKIDEITLYVFPDAHGLNNINTYHSLYSSAIAACAALQDRFCIVDVRMTELDPADIMAPVNAFRSGNLGDAGAHKYSAAYYPWVTTVLNYTSSDEQITIDHTMSDGSDGPLDGVTLAAAKVGANAALITNEFENKVKGVLLDVYVDLPPSSLIAGVYAGTDRTRGVWKAPANVGLSSIVGPTAIISHEDQMDMNIHSSGRSVNAIRSFTGKGTLVWGARTLAGNDNEWRYVSVRRFFKMVEESVKKASEQFVFEPNDANTWVKVRAMIENFLTLQWRAGALAGAKPEHAFYVKVGLGSTMTALDILEGRMIVEIGMAAVRPAEFIILRFSHKMQES